MSDALETLKFDIISRASLGHEAATGFYPVHCPVCNKPGKKTGGFRFDSDKIIYNCFRAKCDASTVFEVGNPPSRKFKNLMKLLHVDIPLEFKVQKPSLYKQAVQKLDENLYKQHFYREIEVPDGWFKIKKSHPRYQYFLDRKVDPSGFYDIRSGDYKGLVGIPLYYYKKLIGFQIATQNKYITYQENNTQLIAPYGGRIENPVIVVEGVLDALCFPHAVGLLKNRMTPEQAYFLRGKEVILFPDKNSGDAFLNTMKTYRWKMVVPPWRDVKDMNDCVVKYGIFLTARMIKENTYTDPMKAAIAYRLWSKS